jgi:hypothetical protein
MGYRVKGGGGSGSTPFPSFRKYIVAGLGVTPILNMTALPEDSAGFDIETKVYSYTGTKPIATATNIGSDNFANIANAEGNPDGASAFRRGKTFSTTSAQLRGQHVAIPVNDDVSIALVELRFYVDQQATFLNNGGLELALRANSSASWTTLATYAGNVDFLTTPDVYTVTGLTTWDQVNDLETRVSVTLPALTGLLTCRCDAIVKYVEGVES